MRVMVFYTTSDRHIFSLPRAAYNTRHALRCIHLSDVSKIIRSRLISVEHLAYHLVTGDNNQVDSQ